MKQEIIRDSNFNEIEYREYDNNGNLIYQKWTHYYYDIENQRFSNKIYEIIDSIGKSQIFTRNGDLIITPASSLLRANWTAEMARDIENQFGIDVQQRLDEMITAEIIYQERRQGVFR